MTQRKQIILIAMHTFVDIRNDRMIEKERNGSEIERESGQSIRMKIKKNEQKRRENENQNRFIIVDQLCIYKHSVTHNSQ